MTVRSRICLLTVILVGMIAGGARAAETATPEQRSVVEQIVHDYILRHPELLVRALKSAPDAAKAQATESNSATVAATRDARLDDTISLVAGNAAGDVTIVEFFDYRCGYCKQVEPALDALLREDRGIRIVYKELPILGKDSRYATQVALASRKQAKYREFHAAMMATKGPVDQAVVLDIAAAVGLDVARAEADMQSVEIDDLIERNLSLAKSLGIRGTPTFVIGDEIVFGAIDIAAMRQKVAAARGTDSRESSEAPVPRPAAPPLHDWRG
jgi:protein-disulfide isomerase